MPGRALIFSLIPEAKSWARDGMDVAELLEDLTPEKAAEIGSAAQAKVLARHCYSSRAREVDGLLRGVQAVKQAGGGMNGRASCSAIVCQYGYNEGVAVPYKKTIR